MSIQVQFELEQKQRGKRKILSVSEKRNPGCSGKWYISWMGRGEHAPPFLCVNVPRGYDGTNMLTELDRSSLEFMRKYRADENAIAAELPAAISRVLAGE